MAKVKRKIIKIDEELCTGCGECVPSCVEQALQIVETPKGKKARLVKEIYCDGLGACLGSCPTGALIIEERESEPFDEEATDEWMKKISSNSEEYSDDSLEKHQEIKAGTFSCPSAKTLHWTKEKITNKATPRIDSELRQWPVQLHLLPPNAPYFQNADLNIIADCVPFAYANFHQDFIKDHIIAMGCPKLEDVNAYIISQIIKNSNLKSIKIVHMEVPCCSGLIYIVQEAMKKAGITIPLEEITITIRGQIK